jgi:anti-sigma B factor antagonist
MSLVERPAAEIVRLTQCGRRSVSKATVVVSTEPLSVKEQHGDPTRVPGFVDFQVSVSAAGSAATVSITGDLDCYSSPQLRAALLEVIGDGARHVTLDIGGTQFIDSTGLSVLVGGLRRVQELGGTMVVQSPTDTTRRLFDITGLSPVFDIS